MGCYLLPESNAIKLLYNYALNESRVGIVGPKLLNSDGSTQDSCFRFPDPLLPLYRRTFLGKFFNKKLDYFIMSDFDKSSTRKVDWLMGSCLMVSKKTLDRVGCFDKRYFMYFEDIDLCRSVKKLGLNVIYHPGAIVIHDHGRASAQKPWYLAPFTEKLAREHIKSWIKYFYKWKLKSNDNI